MLYNFLQKTDSSKRAIQIKCYCNILLNRCQDSIWNVQAHGEPQVPVKVKTNKGFFFWPSDENPQLDQRQRYLIVESMRGETYKKSAIQSFVSYW